MQPSGAPSQPQPQPPGRLPPPGPGQDARNRHCRDLRCSRTVVASGTSWWGGAGCRCPIWIERSVCSVRIRLVHAWVKSCCASTFVDEQTIAAALAERHGMRVVDLQRIDVDNAVARTLDRASAVRYRAVPIAVTNGVTVVAVADPSTSSRPTTYAPAITIG